MLALYAALDRGELGKEQAREINELHRSLRGKFEELQPGDLLSRGRYLLLSERARSSTPGIVWHAYDLRLEHEVALRLFNATHDDAGFRGYIRGQAHAMARLRHPFIAAVLDPDMQDEPHYGYTTEFLRGGRLIERVERMRGDVGAVVALTTKLANALEFAHARGLIHGALEIRCVDFAEDGEPRLRDFGLSTSRSEARISRGLLPFLAPELLAGGEPTPAVDQYALAKLAVACLIGRETPPVSAATDLLVSLGASGALTRALQQALDTDPDQRFAGVAELRAALDLAQEADSGAPMVERRSAVQRAASPSANPFSAGRPLDGTQVPGRDEDIDRLLGLVADRGSALLLGPRRSGKTSLLRHVARALAAEHPVWSISLEPYPCDTPDAIAVALAPELQNTAGPARVFAERLKKETRWPVILLDELGFLRNADVQVMPSVFSWLRSISQESASIVYAGSPGDWNQVIEAARMQPGSSFGNDIIVHELGPLSREGALAFLAGTAPPDAPIPAEPLGAWILEDCGTWPFYLQVMGYALVDTARRKADRRPFRDRKALYELYETRLIRERNHVFQARWRELAPRVRELILRERGRLPEYTELPIADKKVVRDGGMFDALNGGWLLDRDPPFFDWIRRKYDELEEP